MRSLGEQELRNIVIGSGLLGSGGGGSTAEGMKLVDRILQFSDSVDIVLPEELDPHQWGPVIAGIGSPKSSLTRVRTKSPTIALEILEQINKREYSFVVPFEIGAGNSLNPMLASVQKNIPIIDGDPCGRAVPEIHMTTFYIGGIELTPLALATEDAITAVIRTPDPRDAERVTRAITAELEGVSAIAAQEMNGNDVQNLIIPKTTTKTEKIGNAIRKHAGNKTKIIKLLVDDFDGIHLGSGTIHTITGETRGGFDFGSVDVHGDHSLKILFQNENMLAYRDGNLVAMVPDLICTLGEDGLPLTNADLAEGMEVSYIGFPAPALFRTIEVCDLFQPILSQLGYTDTFVPIEKLS